MKMPQPDGLKTQESQRAPQTCANRACPAVQQPFTRPTTIEYVRAFPQSEDGPIQVEVNVGAVGVESNLLAQFAVFKHGHSERVLADTHGVFFPADLVSASVSLQRRWPFRRHHAKLPLDRRRSCRRDAMRSVKGFIAVSLTFRRPGIAASSSAPAAR